MAIEAFCNKTSKTKDGNDWMEKPFKDLSKRFPGLTWDRKDDYFELLGYQFGIYPTGTNIYSGETSYSLNPLIKRGDWIYDLPSLGKFILWAEMREVFKKKV